MSIWQVIILSIVEGLTEFLPISSTAHLMVGAHLLGLPNSDFIKSFEIFIQLGAILAVVMVYWRRLVSNFGLIKKVLLAFIPTALIGFLAYPFVKNILLESLSTVAWALFIGGLILILFEWWYEKTQGKEAGRSLDSLTYGECLVLGLVQSLAIIPGVSRAGATIVGGLGLGFSRRAIVEFSFLLALPTMIAATGYDLLKGGLNFGGNETSVLFSGFLLSFLFAWVAVKWLIGFIEQHSFVWFGVYRIVLAILIVLLIL
ncbi:MAG: undecaprenyl-diphosphatase UppP [Candidatus Vogelbacteria bacterium RIFOXYD1_FULL_44_32]|uniref:Undecaprenyl-diphosphatase n=1 Tax=Candidatus Vogelbacteria bacterium RIFOXYD1_FULL_44_32 TaxID=1802438 RepID=A0A1G2QDQ9_9BACT|nr:MAG: undecaprenyl-diphosphatase UppP [Candidatus Vogelbacteria bacterium RIFOXYD1_FULL_44_32]